MYIFSLLFEINFFIDDSDHSCSYKEEYSFPMLPWYWYNTPLSPKPVVYQLSTTKYMSMKYMSMKYMFLIYIGFIIKYNIFFFDKQQYTLRKLIVVQSFHILQLLLSTTITFRLSNRGTTIFLSLVNIWNPIGISSKPMQHLLSDDKKGSSCWMLFWWIIIVWYWVCVSRYDRLHTRNVFFDLDWKWCCC